MIALDTNVLVRLLTRDDPRQFAAARRYVEHNVDADEPAFIDRIVVVELVWVLESAYDEYEREQIAGALAVLLETAEFSVEDADCVRFAVEQYRSGTDFADALIVSCNEKRGCTATATFDKSAAKRLQGFLLIA